MMPRSAEPAAGRTAAEALRDHYDVIVVGAGNAAMCAALSAREQGATVLVLERAPRAERGGNTAFTAGAVRVAYEGVDDLLGLMPDLAAGELSTTDFGTYPARQFFHDLARLTEYRADPDLADRVVRDSHAVLRWLYDKGIRFAPAYGRQAFRVGERMRFWGGLTIEVVGGGPGLVERQHGIAARGGVQILYEAPATGLLHDDQGVKGVRARVAGETRCLSAEAVVLACGGFQANAEWRARYLGPGWDLAKVRGTRFNTGDGHRMALEAGAAPIGHWSGCHAVAWDRNAPDFGDLAVGDGFQKHSYPFGIMVNADGRRFVDEGADFRNYTYASYGGVILRQPHQFAWQIFDQQVTHLLRDEYRIREVTRVQADTVDELAGRLEGVDGRGFLQEVAAFNGAVRADVPFDPTIKDGRGTTGLAIPKSNWANRLDRPPFVAYQVTCGITFTFGGIRVNAADAQVMHTDGHPIPRLYAAGEIVGGLFYFNYPGGSGLTAGAVLGRQAGKSAALAGRR